LGKIDSGFHRQDAKIAKFILLRFFLSVLGVFAVEFGPYLHSNAQEEVYLHIFELKRMQEE